MGRFFEALQAVKGREASYFLASSTKCTKMVRREVAWLYSLSRALTADAGAFYAAEPVLALFQQQEPGD